MGSAGRSRNDDGPALAEADWSEPVAPRAGAQDHLVAVLKEPARFSGRKVERGPAALSELKERAVALAGRCGDRTRTEEVARIEIAAVRRVMGQNLRRRPIHVERRADG